MCDDITPPSHSAACLLGQVGASMELHPSLYGQLKAGDRRGDHEHLGSAIRGYPTDFGEALRPWPLADSAICERYSSFSSRIAISDLNMGHSLLHVRCARRLGRLSAVRVPCVLGREMEFAASIHSSTLAFSFPIQ